jgi:hypothetical protein
MDDIIDVYRIADATPTFNKISSSREELIRKTACPGRSRPVDDPRPQHNGFDRSG